MLYYDGNPADGYLKKAALDGMEAKRPDAYSTDLPEAPFGDPIDRPFYGMFGQWKVSPA